MKIAVNSFPGNDPSEPIRYVEIDPIPFPGVWIANTGRWVIEDCYLIEPTLILPSDDEFLAQQWAKWAAMHWTAGALPTMEKRRGR